MPTQELTFEQHRQLFQEIVSLYDLGENVLDTFDAALENGQLPSEALKEQRFALASPVVEKTQACADTVSDIYMRMLESKQKPSSQDIRMIEKSIRSVFNEILNYSAKLAALPADRKG